MKKILGLVVLSLFAISASAADLMASSTAPTVTQNIVVEGAACPGVGATGFSSTGLLLSCQSNRSLLFAVTSMFANKLVAILLIKICTFQALISAWDEIPQSTGADETWSKVECQPGSGWQPCVKRHKKYAYITQITINNRPYCRGGGSFKAYVRNGILYGNPRPPAVPGSYSYGGSAPSSFSIGPLVGKVLDGCAGNPNLVIFINLHH
ncbi:hypothetical protein [Pseudomonas aeruginosa]|uniref:hypothetical protein n=1 Tax=Pseudomonas aeruginosa TaxID=287 RepID=UPI002E2B0E24|nr:hypothetical protein [Pseudomonas aeruginosa]